ncbi:MAG TPA: ATP-dependent DNA ligase [Casimicrobiaceae bacterium]|nr:ATP-dependent DNA ligase [Casimicrobiaceae bacterium]
MIADRPTEAAADYTLLGDLVETSRRVGDDSSRRKKIEHIAGFLRRLAPSEIALAVSYLSGLTRQGKTGVGWALLREAQGSSAHSGSPALTLGEVDAILERIAAATGSGSTAERLSQLASLFARATPPEQEFLSRLLLGELRQGALEGLMIEAVATAADLPAAGVRRAAMVGGGITAVAAAALAEGAAGLARYAIALFRPLAPMLAQPADDIGEALAKIPAAALEWKLDGARVQVHKHGEEVRLYTRTGNDVTAAAPEIVAAVRASSARDLILDGEAIALKPSGAPYPFQETMSRFGRVLDIDAMRARMPLSVFFFDCLRRDDVDLVSAPATERFDAVANALPPERLIPRLVTSDAIAAQSFYDDALARGHEGVMVKSLDAPYEPGARSAQWLKVKRAHTLDLVVLAAEWGHGRRRGRLSNLHLGARDPASGGFVMLGKTFKGMTDAILAWQTGELLSREISRDEWTVHVRPELVVEIAFNDLQSSPRYPAGLALRFARVKGYRPDKSARDADTIETVRAIYARQDR